MLHRSNAFTSPTNGKIESMRDVSTITLWVSQIPNLGIYILAGVMAGVISAAAIRLLAHLSGNNPGYEHVSETSVPAVVHTAERYVAAWRDRRRRFSFLRLCNSQCLLSSSSFFLQPQVTRMCRLWWSCSPFLGAGLSHIWLQACG